MTWSLFRYAVHTLALRNPRLSDSRTIGRVNREYLVIPVLSVLAFILSVQDVTFAGAVYLAAPFLLWWMIDRDGLDT